ncbi:MAG: ribosome small subunit-dependent GTPase A [Bacteroidetes bacterium]|nr:MAG: ribosome small subunit-dependent GTPase A [Bacteroidota bacterium]
MEGIVTKSTGSWFTVRKPDGEKIECKIKGAFRLKGIESSNPVAVGDRVDYELEEDGVGVIFNIHERTNYIIRRATKLSARSHIIASNIDCAYLMITVTSPTTPLLFIDRFLVTAEAYHIPAEILINKIDLLGKKQKQELDKVITIYEPAGYKCHPMSVLNNIGIDKVIKQLTGKVNLIAGNSGVGKSSLLNKLDPDWNLKTAGMSSRDTGKHTTTFAEMYELKNETFVIDTPGLKSFGTYDLEKEDLSHRFPEMRLRMDACHFSNCLHINEPRCAVINAVENKEIAESRYKNYLNIYNSDETENYR